MHGFYRGELRRRRLARTIEHRSRACLKPEITTFVVLVSKLFTICNSFVMRDSTRDRSAMGYSECYDARYDAYISLFTLTFITIVCHITIP